MMELLKAKYNTVASEKALQSQQLIQLEEDKLSLARTLVELKLEHSQLQEQAEKDRFDLTSNLLTAKSDNFELDSQVLLAKTENISLKEDNTEMEKIIKTNQEEMAGLNASLKEVRESLKREEEKNVELGTELLTLLNQKDTLQAKANDLQRRLDEASVRLAVLTNHENEVDQSLEALRAQLRTSEEELTTTKRQLGDSELESRRLAMEMERLSKDTQRANEDMAKEIEEEKAKLQRQKEEMQAQFAQQLKDLTSKGNKQETIPLTEANAQKVKLERQVRDMEREKQRAVDDLAAAVKERKKIEADLSALRETYRKKLSTSLADAADRVGTPSSTAKPPPGAPPLARRGSQLDDARGQGGPETQNAPDPDAALRDLMISYGDREKRLRSDLEYSNSRNAAQRAAFRAFRAKCAESVNCCRNESSLTR
jgi:chromosome segregation ATPase